MSDKVELNLDVLRELNRQSYVLFRYFSTVLSDINKASSSPSVADDIVASETPHLAYKYSDKDVTFSIRLDRDNHYHIECLGIVLTKTKPFIARGRVKTDYRYQNLYGDFESFDDVVTAFHTLVKQYINNELGELF